MNNIFRIEESDLASRRSAALLRSEAEACLLDGIAILDLSEVQSISESYADEFFGVLVEHYTLSWVFARLRVVGASAPVIRTITHAIRYRLEKSASREASKAVSQKVRAEVTTAVERHSLAFA